VLALLEALLVFLKEVVLLFVLPAARVLMRIAADHRTLLGVALSRLLLLLGCLLGALNWLVRGFVLLKIAHFERLNNVLFGLFVADFGHDFLDFRLGHVASFLLFVKQVGVVWFFAC